MMRTIVIDITAFDKSDDGTRVVYEFDQNQLANPDNTTNLSLAKVRTSAVPSFARF